MGTEWYIFDHDKHEYFELGKGPWGRNTITVTNSDGEDDEVVDNSWLFSHDKVVNYVKNMPSFWPSKMDSGSYKYMLWMHDEIWSFAEGRKNISIMWDEVFWVASRSSQKLKTRKAKMIGSRYTDDETVDKHINERYGHHLDVVYEVITE